MRFFRTMLLAAAAMLPLTAVANAGITTSCSTTFSTAQSEFTCGVPNEGLWSPTYVNNPNNSNYFAGTYHGDTTNNFFTFDLSCLKQQVCSATLEIKSACYIGCAPCLTYNIYDVCTPACVIDSRCGASTTLFNALDSGPAIGTVTVKSTDKNSTVCINLNDCGIKDLNCAAGGFFTIGGSICTPNPCGVDQGLFGFSGNNPCGQSLVCETCCGPCGPGDPGGSSVPLPAGALLLPAALAAAGFCGFRMRRRLLVA